MRWHDGRRDRCDYQQWGGEADEERKEACPAG